jgi:hypothetical protein
METVWAITGVAVPALLGVGIGLMVLPLLENRTLAVVCFALAGAWLGVVGFMWLIHTPTSTLWRVVAGLGIGVAVFVVIPQLIRIAWPQGGLRAQIVTIPPDNPPPASSAPITITGGDNVVSVGQIGGITARTVTINPPMHPEFRILEKKESNNPDGSHTVDIIGDVASPITPGLLVLQVTAQGLRSVSVMPAPVGGMSGGTLRNKRQMSNFFSVEVSSPRGQYIISVVTAAPTNVQLDASF